MKKKLCSIVCLCYFVSIMLCACGRKEQGNPIRLPAREDIVSIGVSDGDKYAISPNTEGEATEFIDEFLSMLMDMETTSQQSINDAPVNKDSITININCDGAAGTTLFYYVDKGIEYVEQPYQGIYKPTPALGNCITEMLASADNRPLMVTFQASVIETNHDSIIVKPVDGSVADGLFCREIDGLFCRSSPDIIVRRRCVLSHKRRGWLQPSPSFRYSRNLALQDELYHPVINNGPAVLVCVDKRLGTGPVNQSRDAG